MSRKSKRKHKQAKGQASGAGDKRITLARKADKYVLYEAAVQHPDADVKFANRLFKKRFDRQAQLLREDFCGTGKLACEWVEQSQKHRAWGVDIDPEPLEYGRIHHVAALRDDERRRVELIQGDVLDTHHELVDVTVAFNFSYYLFKTRAELLAYFKEARATLKEEGLFILDAYGGPEAQTTMLESEEFDDFEYVWDQDVFDPINHHAVNYIHFEFSDGSRIHKAFHYDWRLWTLPEITELLIEAGFSETEVYWEGADRKTNEGNGVFRKATSAPDDPAWVAYIVGVA